MRKQQERLAREEKILSNLDKLGFANRRQLQIINELGGDRNANRILKEMEKDKLVKAIRFEEKVYFVAGSGKERIGSGKAERKGLIVHTLMTNDLYIYLGMPSTWTLNQTIDINYQGQDLVIIPDAWYQQKGKHHFVEVDNMQQMKTNKEKIKKYKKLSEAIYDQQRHYPSILFYTLTEGRKRALEDAIQKEELKGHVLVKGEF